MKLHNGKITIAQLMKVSFSATMADVSDQNSERRETGDATMPFFL
jgi:hypothetical protein